MSELSEHHHHNSHLPHGSEAKNRPRPRRWGDFRATIRHKVFVPLWFIDWLAEWGAYGLSQLSLLELLEHIGSFSVLIALAVYLVEIPERVKVRHYQAWQVINTAQGKGGSGGRIDALHELNEDHIPLVGVDVSGAYLQGVGLGGADVHNGNFNTADLRDVDFRAANVSSCDFHFANLERAKLGGADVSNVDLGDADLRDADLADIVNWKEVKSYALANIHGVQHAPEGFAALAKSRGAVDVASDEEWRELEKSATK